MNTVLYVARFIHHDLKSARARSWQWWTALTEADYKDNLICNQVQAIEIIDRVQPGYKRF